MFDGLTKGFAAAFSRLRGGKLTEANIKEGLAEVKRSLLEADVNFNVVNDFVARVESDAIGQKVIAQVNPADQFVKIVYDRLVELMGPVDHKIRWAKDRPTVLMMCGLQGAGKTTTCGKLALKLRNEENRRVLLVAADLQRPGAVEQLRVLAGQIDVKFYSEGADPVAVCVNGVKYAQLQGLDTVILDTAGRLHIDEDLIAELEQIDKKAKPDAAFLVTDAMTGQDAVNSAKAFNEALELDGVILTKLDGDARGGAALSIREIAKVPVKFIGVGEKLQQLENFHPERMAGRILGQGDLMGLVEKVQRAQSSMDQVELEKQRAKLETGKFTLDDFRKQFSMMTKMGGMKDMLGKLPGFDKMIPEGEDPEEAMTRVQGMIDSMTPKERVNPSLIDLSRRRRIAAGSGTEPHEIKQLLVQFEQVKGIVQQMQSMTMWQKMKMMTGMGQAGMFQPGGMDQVKTKGNTGKRKSPKERAEERKKKKKKR